MYSYTDHPPHNSPPPPHPDLIKARLHPVKAKLYQVQVRKYKQNLVSLHSCTSTPTLITSPPPLADSDDKTKDSGGKGLGRLFRRKEKARSRSVKDELTKVFEEEAGKKGKKQARIIFPDKSKSKVTSANIHVLKWTTLQAVLTLSIIYTHYIVKLCRLCKKCH